jgi:hypothetical protein
MHRTPFVITGVLAALVSAAVIATSGSAQAPVSTTTLNLKGKDQKGVGFFPKHRPRQGDLLGFGEKLTGDETGVDRGVCVVIGRDEATCTIQIRLSKGTLTAQGTGHEKDTNAPFAITGGTGAYDGARGTALVTDTSATTSSIKVTLLP